MEEISFSTILENTVPKLSPSSKYVSHRDNSGLYLYTINNPQNQNDYLGLISSDKCERCGPDISDPLKMVIWKMRGDFYSWNWLKRKAVCRGLDDLPTGLVAWDIYELSPRDRARDKLNSVCPGCPTEQCQYTVEVDGNCFSVSRVNYVQFGTMGRLCGWSLSYTMGIVNMWKTANNWLKLKGDIGADRDTTEWTVVGYNGWPRYPTPSTSPDLKKCKTDCPKYNTTFRYYWLGSGSDAPFLRERKE
jgi:hypothetical protein